MNRRVLGMFAAALLALSAAVGVAPAATAATDGASYVAFGDSEAAGTGNFLYVDRACKRSRISYPLILGASSYACAGATTADLAGQITAAEDKLGGSTKLVTVTAGVNDLDWQAVLTICYSQGDQACEAALAGAAGQLPSVAANLTGALGAIRGEAPGAKILVTGYPHLFADTVPAAGCRIGWYAGGQVTVSPTQAALANAGVDGLNAAIAQAVAATGDPRIHYLDVTSTFAGHELCGSGTDWINGVVGLPVVSDASLHVNGAGQFALAALVWRNR